MKYPDTHLEQSTTPRGTEVLKPRESGRHEPRLQSHLGSTHHEEDLERIPEEIRRYQLRVFKKILLPWALSSGGLLAAWLISWNPSYSRFFNFPSISGGTLLGGFGLLATLVVAIQVLARSLRQTDKRNGPGPAEFLGKICWIILLAVSGLTTLGVVLSFDFSNWPSQPTFDWPRGLGTLVFGLLIAMFASDAAEHARLLDYQSDAFRMTEIREAEMLVRAFPGRRPSKVQRSIQVVVLFIGCPLIAGLSGILWFGWAAGVLGFSASAVLAGLALVRLRRLCALWYARSRWSLLGDVAFGALIWMLFASTFMVAILQTAIAGSLGSEVSVVFEKLFRFMAFFVLTTLPPFYAASWMCRTYGAGRRRGLVLDSAARQQSRRLLKLRDIPLRSSFNAETAVQRISGWVREHKNEITAIQLLMDNLSLVLLVVLGAALAVAVAWLVFFGPPAFIAMFPEG